MIGVTLGVVIPMDGCVEGISLGISLGFEEGMLDGDNVKVVGFPVLGALLGA